MKSYKYKMHTISNKINDVVELPLDERTRHLLKIGAVEELVIEKPKPTVKGGRKPQSKKAETK